jgi:hypothetical protein
LGVQAFVVTLSIRELLLHRLMFRAEGGETGVGHVKRSLEAAEAGGGRGVLGPSVLKVCLEAFCASLEGGELGDLL